MRKDGQRCGTVLTEDSRIFLILVVTLFSKIIFLKDSTSSKWALPFKNRDFYSRPTSVLCNSTLLKIAQSWCSVSKISENEQKTIQVIIVLGTGSRGKLTGGCCSQFPILMSEHLCNELGGSEHIVLTRVDLWHRTPPDQIMTHLTHNVVLGCQIPLEQKRIMPLMVNVWWWNKAIKP